MNKIEQMVKEMCPGGVKSKKWGDCVQVITAPKKLKTTDYLEVGQYPVIDQGQKFIVGYSNDVSAVISGGPYCLFGDHTREIKYVDFDFIQGADGLKILKTKNGILSRYFLHCMRFSDIPNRGYNRHWSIAKEIEIPLPPLPIQEAIVEILDKFESLQQGLQDELQARKKQYEYYRNKLLTQFPDNVEVKEFSLGEICEFVKDGTHSSFKDVEDGYPLLSAKDITNGAISITEKCRKISKKDFDSIYTRYKLAQGDVLVTIVGSIGRTAIIKDNIDIAFQRSVGILRPKSIVLSSYLYYSIQTSSVQNQLAAKTNKSAQGGVYLGELSKIRMVLPPIEKQKETVSILDKLETLVNDQEKGIPAEIAAVKKQYEYYRNKLLTF